MYLVLNLIITGIPSIPLLGQKDVGMHKLTEVLNLIITGIPSIPSALTGAGSFLKEAVLNLIITGIPSIP